MKHKQETRRTLARGRRKEDIKKYEKLLKSKHKGDKEIERKLKVAKKDVEALGVG